VRALVSVVKSFDVYVSNTSQEVSSRILLSCPVISLSSVAVVVPLAVLDSLGCRYNSLSSMSAMEEERTYHRQVVAGCRKRAREVVATPQPTLIISMRVDMLSC
jgi:hypothetical protein